MNIAQELRSWATDLDSGRITQTFGGGTDATTQSACVRDSWYLRHEEEIPAGFHEPLFAVAEETYRIVGIEETDPQRTCLPILNDVHRVPFATFAQAMRNVARKMEEQGPGAPIVAERELVPA